MTQTIFAGDPQGRQGNCWQAAIASLLGMPLDDVPHFVDDSPDTWWEDTRAWASARGVNLTIVDSGDRPFGPPETYGIATGPSPRGVLHAVLVDLATCELVHDPHPSRAGIAEPWVDLVYVDATSVGLPGTRVALADPSSSRTGTVTTCPVSEGAPLVHVHWDGTDPWGSDEPADRLRRLDDERPHSAHPTKPAGADAPSPVEAVGAADDTGPVEDEGAGLSPDAPMPPPQSPTGPHQEAPR